MTTQLSAPLSDYIGRTVDFLFYDNLKERGESLLTPTLALPGQSGALITGIQKLVQRFLLELLTERGSMPYALNRGTLFMAQLRAGVIRTSQELFASFSVAALDVQTQLQLEELATDPLDERFKQARLLAVDLSGDHASLTIQIISLAETDYTVIYPLRITSL